MDRRAALKKLGVGGAVAVSGPLLLDAFNVAHAVSPFTATAADLNAAIVQPSPGNSKTLSLSFTNPGQLFPAGTTFQWADLPAGPGVTFSSSTTLATNMTVQQGNMNSKSFSVALTATFGGNSETYVFNWARNGPMSAS